MRWLAHRTTSYLDPYKEHEQSLHAAFDHQKDCLDMNLSFPADKHAFKAQEIFWLHPLWNDLTLPSVLNLNYLKLSYVGIN